MPKAYRDMFKCVSIVLQQAVYCMDVIMTKSTRPFVHSMDLPYVYVCMCGMLLPMSLNWLGSNLGGGKSALNNFYVAIVPLCTHILLIHGIFTH